MTRFARHDIALSLAACTATAAGGALLTTLLDEQILDLILLFCVIGVVFQLVAVVLGLTWLVGAALAPLMVATALGGAASDAAPTATWVVVGCLWFLGAELGWEAIDRRDAMARDGSASLSRLIDVATVIGLAGATALVAVVGSSAPPARSFPLQALMLLVFCLAAVQLSRRISGRQEAPEPSR